MPYEARMLLFPGPPKTLPNNSVAKARRVGKTKARSEVVVSGRGQSLGNARIAGIYEALGRIRKDRRLLSLNPSLDLSLCVVPRHADFPAKTQIQRQIGSCLPSVLHIGAAIARARIQEL